MGMANLLDQQRARNLEKQQKQDLSDKTEDEYYQDTYSDTPKHSVKDIVGDLRLTLPARVRAVRRVEALQVEDAPRAVSAQTTNQLFDRMYLPDGDPRKLTSEDAIIEAKRQGKLSRTDFDWLHRRFKEMRTPEGASLTEYRADLLKAVLPKIENSMALLADRGGPLEAYNYKRALDRKIDEYRKEGKNPFDLFDPSKPDYMGKPEVLAPYIKGQSLTTQMQQNVASSFAERFGASAKPPNTNLTGPGKEVTGMEVIDATIPPRQPGESLADWLKRTGRGLAQP